MRRIIALILLVVLCLAAPLFADATSPDAGSQTGTALEGQWWYGRTIEAFTFNGLQNVSQRTAGAVVRPYVGQVFTTELENAINNSLYSQSWLEYVESMEMIQW